MFFGQAFGFCLYCCFDHLQSPALCNKCNTFPKLSGLTASHNAVRERGGTGGGGGEREERERERERERGLFQSTDRQI